jgi:hypothetical protein
MGSRSGQGTESRETRSLPTTGIDHGVASGIGLREDEIEVPVLRIGDLDIADVAATRTPTGADVVPLLGMSALARFRCHFRFADCKMELVTSRPHRTNTWFELDMHAAGQPTMPVRISDLEVAGCWDTGAGLTVVDAKLARTHPELFEPIRAAIGIDASGVQMSTQIARMRNCSIGDMEFPASACAFVDLSDLNAHLNERATARGRSVQPMSFIIGMPLINQVDWVIDFPAQRWTVGRPRTG